MHACHLGWALGVAGVPGGGRVMVSERTANAHCGKPMIPQEIIYAKMPQGCIIIDYIFSLHAASLFFGIDIETIKSTYRYYTGMDRYGPVSDRYSYTVSGSPKTTRQRAGNLVCKLTRAGHFLWGLPVQAYNKFGWWSMDDGARHPDPMTSPPGSC